MQQVVAVLGVAVGRLVRIPGTAPDHLDAEGVFVALQRIHGTLDEDVSCLHRPYQKQFRRDLDLFDAPSMSSGDFIVVRFSTNPIQINGRHFKRPSGTFAIVECVPHTWELLLVDDDESLRRQVLEHWSTISLTKEPST